MCVKVDESYFYRTKKSACNKGRSSPRPKQWCMGLLHRGSNKVIFKMVHARDSSTMLPIISKYVRRSSTVISDGWRVYPKVVELKDDGGQSLDLRHEFVCHDKEFVTEEGIHINGIESCWSVVKRVHASRYGTRCNLIQSHLHEAAARWNCGGGSLGNHSIFFLSLFDLLSKQ